MNGDHCDIKVIQMWVMYIYVYMYIHITYNII